MSTDDPDHPDDASDQFPDRTLRLPPGDRTLCGKKQEGRDLMFAQLRAVDMTGADFYWALFHNADLTDAIMARCDLRGATLNEANLRGADLTNANCGLDNVGGSTDFIKADLSGADLRNANISGADFTDAILVGANLSGALAESMLDDRPTKFIGANLTEARLSGARLRGALYDARTVFPTGFAPEHAGMVLKAQRS